VVGAPVPVAVHQEDHGTIVVDFRFEKIPGAEAIPEIRIGGTVFRSDQVDIIIKGVADIRVPAPTVIISATAEGCFHEIGDAVIGMLIPGGRFGFIVQGGGLARIHGEGVVLVMLGIRGVLPGGDGLVHIAGLGRGVAGNEVRITMCVVITNNHAHGSGSATMSPGISRCPGDGFAAEPGSDGVGFLCFHARRRGGAGRALL